MYGHKTRPLLNHDLAFLAEVLLDPAVFPWTAQRIDRSIAGRCRASGMR